jgi:hypothetical protein
MLPLLLVQDYRHYCYYRQRAVHPRIQLPCAATSKHSSAYVGITLVVLHIFVCFMLHMYHACVYMCCRACDDALQATQLLPNYAKCWLRAGDAFNELGKQQEAADYYQV